MKFKLLALLFGIGFGGYIVVHNGPPELGEKIKNWITHLGDPLATSAQGRPAPTPKEQQANLIKKIEDNLSSLDRLTVIAEDVNKKNIKENGGAAKEQTKPTGILETLFGVKTETPEEKIRNVVQDTKKMIAELQVVNKEVLQTSGSGSGVAIPGSGLASAPLPVSSGSGFVSPSPRSVTVPPSSSSGSGAVTQSLSSITAPPSLGTTPSLESAHIRAEAQLLQQAENLGTSGTLPEDQCRRLCGAR